MIFPLILIVLSSITRLAFFGYPSAVVFDEVYNGRYVGNYADHTFYFDVHPPLAKILVTFWSHVVGMPAGVDFTAIGNGVPWQITLLRLLPILSGILLPLIIYYICRHLSFSKMAAFAAGLLVVFENSLVVQSRFILFDGFLLLFGFLSVLSYLSFSKNRSRWWLLAVSFIFGSAALSVKWTGMAFPLLIVILEAAHLWKGSRRFLRIAKFTSLYAAVGIIFYLSVFAVHFAYLTRSGPGDAFMSDRFQKTLVGNSHENDPVTPKRFFGKAIELNIKMYEANLTLTKPHQYSSLWFTWPVMQRPIFYWQSPAGKEGDPRGYIYLLGNPLIYWGGSLATLFLLWRILLKKDPSPTAFFIVSGFLVNFIPFVFIGRVMFLYHYEAALVFTILALVYCLDRLPEELKKKIWVAVIGLAVALFLFFGPLTYGTPLSDKALHSRMWFSSWR